MPESLSISDLFVPALILCGGALVFAILMLIAVVQWKKVAEARAWPVARGRILESRVTEGSDSDGGTTYIPVIKYEYQVGHEIYTNDLLAFGSRNLTEGGSRGEKKAHAAVAKYFVGRDVEVRYHPRQPANSVLEVRSVIANMLAFIGVLFLFTGILVAAIVVIVD